MTRPQSVLDALADAETLRDASSCDWLALAEFHGEMAANYLRWPNTFACSADESIRAAHAAFRAVPGLR